MKAFIKAISYALPQQIVTNEDIVRDFPEWTVEKINDKIGIKERHVVDNEHGETALDIGVIAAEKLFEEHDLKKDEVDFLIFCTESADYKVPPSACIMQERLGLSRSIGAMDIGLGCSGWIFSILTAKSFIESGAFKNVLIVTAESYSIYMHPKDKGNRTIFGDGAAATLVSKDGIAEIGEVVVGTDGRGAENLIVKTGGARQLRPINDIVIDEFGNPKSSDFIYMNGPDILVYTLRVYPKLLKQVLDKNHLTMDDINLHVYHQPNHYMGELERKKLKIPDDRFYEYVEKVGNTVSSTIPIAIYHALKDGTLKKGFKVLSMAQGLGYSWGGFVMQF